MGIRSETIAIPTGGALMPAWLAAPSGGPPRAAVIVLMEAFGLVPSFRREVERIARMGYLALAPDLYHRQAPDNVAGYDELPKAIALMRKLSDAEALEDLRATLAYLRERLGVAAPLGVTGFCMGGRLAFLAACELPGELRACAPFYGGGIGALLDRAERIRCPLHLFFGERDFFIPSEEVRRIDERLRALGLDYALEVYPGAVHGFCAEDRRESYHAEAAADAWAKLEAFFAKRLAGA
jgi:carboxymethylenebutenolidase